MTEERTVSAVCALQQNVILSERAERDICGVRVLASEKCWVVVDAVGCRL